MSIFSNDDYRAVAEDIIKDSFYADNSYSSKIASERRCGELIVRKVLDLPTGEKVTLGKIEVVKKIKKLPHNLFFQKAMDGLKASGNINSHTGTTKPATKDDYEKATESLLDMFAYLPVRYFEKYRFGSRNDVMSVFSLLPPVIRFKTLDYLYSVDSKNIAVIDKLVLVIMKNKGSEKAFEWIEEHKAELEKMKVISECAYEDIVKKQGEDIAKMIAEAGPKNMYEMCVGKIVQLKGRIDGKKLMYRTFEEALPYYKEHGHINEDSVEIQEFNDMMEFIYLGRKTLDIEKLEEPYFVINVI